MIPAHRIAVVIAGHGASNDPDTGASAKRLADRLRRRAHFGAVYSGFLRGQPSIEDAVIAAKSANLYPVVVPMMASDGYVTTHLLANRLRAVGADNLLQTPALGTHPDIPHLLAQSIADVANGVDGRQALLVIGHGTRRNPVNAQTTRGFGASVERALASMHAKPMPVHAGFIEHDPFVADALSGIGERTVHVVPFLMAGGFHASTDVPAALGLSPDDATVRAVTSGNRTMSVFNTPHNTLILWQPIGHMAQMTDLANELVMQACCQHQSAA